MQGQQGFDGRGQVLGEACGQQHEVQNHAYIPCAATAKKRKAGGVDTLTGESAGHTAHGVGMRLPEVVATLAAGELLRCTYSHAPRRQVSSKRHIFTRSHTLPCAHTAAPTRFCRGRGAAMERRGEPLCGA